MKHEIIKDRYDTRQELFSRAMRDIRKSFTSGDYHTAAVECGMLTGIIGGIEGLALMFERDK